MNGEVEIEVEWTVVFRVGGPPQKQPENSVSEKCSDDAYTCKFR